MNSARLVAKQLFLVGFLSGAIGGGGLLAQTAAADSPRSSSRPNLIFILADDLGYGDLACNNPDSKIPTPHADRLAAEGMRFTDAHSPSAVCTPTRYSLLTGRYHWRSRLKQGVLDGFSPPLIEADRVTVASFLQQQGYATACVGKWHLGLQWTRTDGSLESADRAEQGGVRPGYDIDYTKGFRGGPLALGFDRYFGISASLNMPPFCYLENEEVVHPPTMRQERLREAPFVATDEGLRSPDFTNYGVLPRLAGEALSFLENHAATAPEQPFFLYFPLPSPHLPVMTNQEYIGKSEAGLYGDFVVETDAMVGAVLETLDRLELAEDTIVIFSSDNGGLFHWWEAKESDDLAHYKVAGRGAAMREYGHQGNAWMRGTKADIWEGGHRVPFLVRWPGHTPAGSVSDELVDLTDLLATMADITGEELPAGAGPDSVSLLPALLSTKPEKAVRDHTVHLSFRGVFAIRQGPWKLIPGHRGSGGFSAPRDLDPAKVGGPAGQLYHLGEDRAETKNRYDDEPEVVARLSKLLESIRREPDGL
ncbi:MAG: arylsulfatase [Verrucomicrobiaceae bacterium]|nr:arylsulfatase [Verrucomicrobiaceae bacterium]